MVHEESPPITSTLEADIRRQFAAKPDVLLGNRGDRMREREGTKQRRPIHRYRVRRLEIVRPAIASEACSVASRQSNSVFKTPSRT